MGGDATAQPSLPAAAGDGGQSAGAASEPTADVTQVSVAGKPGAYTFLVTIRSGDTGCDGYADWWEVVGEDGELIHRRILAHSHVREQPFTRSGGPVPVSASRTVIVRAHRSPGGYAGRALEGSIASGFQEAQLPADFAASLASADPQPSGCAF